MALMVFVDEVGNANLDHTDPDFPVFGVAFVICDSEHYCNRIVPSLMSLKIKYCGTELAILHSRDIRKAQGEFSFLTNAARRQEFIQELNGAIIGAQFKVIAVIIRKQPHRERYGEHARDPYDLAMTLALERLLPELDAVGQTSVRVIAEARGKREDRDVELAFRRTTQLGTWYHRPAQFRRFNWNVHFVPKSGNCIGTQLADLTLYPVARNVIDPTRSHPSWPIVQAKLCGGGRGLKVFP